MNILICMYLLCILIKQILHYDFLKTGDNTTQREYSSLPAINCPIYDPVEYSSANLSKNIKNTFNKTLKATYVLN